MDELSSQSDRQPASSIGNLDQALIEIESLAQQLDQLRQELAWSNRLATLGTMSAMLAHEYNNLLTPIGSYAQLALANPDDEALVVKALGVAAEGVRQAKAIAQATLGFARPGDPDEPESSEIRAAIEQSLVYTGKTLEQARVESTIDVPEARVAMPEMQLQQVLVNLIENARKAMAGQAKRKRLSITASQEQGGWLITVADTGQGFPPTMAECAFDAFATHPLAGEPQAGSGTGLGLRVCKDLITSAGGWIKIDPQSPAADARSETASQHHGATIRFWLPAAA